MALPFWDQPAISKVSTRDPTTGKTTDGQARPAGIVALTPSDPRNPYPDELSPWDVITLNGVRAPGICRVEGGRHVALDLQKLIGQLEPSMVFLNFDPVPITLTLTLWTPAQFAALQDLLPHLLPAVGPNPILRAVKAEHPALALIGCDTLLFQGMELPRHIGHQVIEVVFSTYEFNPKITNTAKDAQNPEPQTAKSAPPPVVPPSQAPIPPS